MAYARAAKTETAMKNMISIRANSNVPTTVTNGIWASTMTSSTDIATGTRPDTTTVTTAVRCALMFMVWTIVMIRTDTHAATKATTPIRIGDILTWPRTRAIVTVSRLDGRIWIAAKTTTQRSTTPTKTQTTDTKKLTGTRIATRNYIGKDSCEVIRTPLIDDNCLMDFAEDHARDRHHLFGPA